MEEKLMSYTKEELVDKIKNYRLGLLFVSVVAFVLFMGLWRGF